MREPTAEGFLKDVKDHKMTVLHHDGPYRHIRFRQPGNSNMWFDLTTWPNMLTISGDMGCWTFSRVEDMFTFFRSTPEDFMFSKLKINPSYWAEKLQHGNFSGRDGGKVWDQDIFKAHLLDQIENHYGFEGEKLTELKAAVEEEIFQLHDGDGPHMMRHAAYEFSYEFEEDRWRTGYDHQRTWKFHFEGMDLPDGMIYSYHFLWCLYAIVWGIQQWDAREIAAAA